MPKKSDNKPALREIFPSVFTNEMDGKSADYAIEDGMIRLQGKAKSITNPTGLYALKRMLSGAVEYLEKDKCQVYVLMFDKIDLVYKIKGAEHALRSSSSRRTLSPDPVEGEDLMPLYSSIPHEWGSMMANRTMRKEFINQITKRIIQLFQPPPGKILIVDGGLLDQEDQPVAIISEEEETPMMKNKCILFSTLPGDGNPAPKTRIMRPPNLKNRVGECDECMMFYLKYFQEDRDQFRMSQILEAKDDPIFIDVITGDTDFIPNCLSFYSRLENDNIQVRIIFPVPNSAREALDPMKDIFLVGDLYRQLKSALGTKLQRPDLGFTVAILLAGNDYCDPYYGTNCKVIQQTFLNEYKYIGDPITVDDNGDWLLDQDSYLRFLKVLYINTFNDNIHGFFAETKKKFERIEKARIKAEENEEKRKKRADKKPPAKRGKKALLPQGSSVFVNISAIDYDDFFEIEDRILTPSEAKTDFDADDTQLSKEERKRKRSTLDQQEIDVLKFMEVNREAMLTRGWEKLLPWSTLRHIIALKYKGRESARIPPAGEIWLKFLRLKLSLLIIEQGYRTGPEIADDICLNHGFSLIEKSRNLSRFNIRKTECRDITDPIPKAFLSTEV